MLTLCVARWLTGTLLSVLTQCNTLLNEGFTQKDMVGVALRGIVVEVYPERNRCLLYADVTIEGLEIPLHLICGHHQPDAPVVFVTAYIPSEDEWETPTRRRKRRR